MGHQTPSIGSVEDRATALALHHYPDCGNLSAYDYAADHQWRHELERLSDPHSHGEPLFREFGIHAGDGIDRADSGFDALKLVSNNKAGEIPLARRKKPITPNNRGVSYRNGGGAASEAP